MFSKSWKAGVCELCRKYVDNLERHHISYKPEITIDLCHEHHFLSHFYPNRLLPDWQIKLLMKKFKGVEAINLQKKYGNNPVELAKLIAPSRREAIHEAQREEAERIIKGKLLNI